MRPLVNVVSLLTAFTLLMSIAAACGGDDDDDDDGASSPTSAATATAGASSAAASPTSAASPAAGDLQPVTVGFVPVLIYGPVILAAEKGYFAEYGLDVTLEPLPGGSDMVTLTANGDFDIGVGGAGPAYFNAVQRGFDLKIIGPLHFERDPPATPLVVSKERFDAGEITSVEDLAGMTVTVNAPGATEYWLATALGTGGLTIEDVELEYLPFPDVAAALASGAIDGAMLGEPLVTRAEQEGIVVRLEADFPADFQPTFAWVNPDFAAEHHDLAVGFMAGMMRGCRDLWGDDWDSDENLAILNQYTNVDVELIRESARTYCEPNGQVNVDDLATLQSFFADRGLLEYDDLLDIETLVDRSYAGEALNEIGEVEVE
jgi:NitT/TauT family transport system substrate-binding protein